MIFANSTHNVEYISPAEMLRLWYLSVIIAEDRCRSGHLAVHLIIIIII